MVPRKRLDDIQLLAEFTDAKMTLLISLTSDIFMRYFRVLRVNTSVEKRESTSNRFMDLSGENLGIGI